MSSLFIIAAMATAVVLLGFALSLRIARQHEHGVLSRLGHLGRRGPSNPAGPA
jgi:hypothetical protein